MNESAPVALTFFRVDPDNEPSANGAPSIRAWGNAPGQNRFSDQSAEGATQEFPRRNGRGLVVHPRKRHLCAMAYASFRQFLEALDQAGELTRVSVPVETDLVLSEWANREMKSPEGGKALLFEKPTIDGRPSEFPVAINTMGSRRRMAMALKLDSVEDLAQEIQLILKAKPPTDLREGWSLLKQGINLLHARPKHAKEGACQEVVHRFAERPTSNVEHSTSKGEEITLRDLPILKCWPKDGGRFITLPNVHTRDPETGARNVGMYRMQVYDDLTTGMHWQGL